MSGEEIMAVNVAINKKQFLRYERVRRVYHIAVLTWLVVGLVVMFMPQVQTWIFWKFVTNDEIMDGLIVYSGQVYAEHNDGVTIFQRDPALNDQTNRTAQNIIENEQSIVAPLLPKNINPDMRSTAAKIADAFIQAGTGVVSDPSLKVVKIVDNFSSVVQTGQNTDVISYSVNQHKLSILRVLPIEQQGKSLSLDIRSCKGEEYPCVVTRTPTYGVHYFAEVGVVDLNAYFHMDDFQPPQLLGLMVARLDQFFGSFTATRIQGMDSREAAAFIQKNMPASYHRVHGGMCWLWIGLLLSLVVRFVVLHTGYRTSLVVELDKVQLTQYASIPGFFEFFGSFDSYPVSMAVFENAFAKKQVEIEAVQVEREEFQQRQTVAVSEKKPKEPVPQYVPNIEEQEAAARQRRVNNYKAEYNQSIKDSKVSPMAEMLFEQAEATLDLKVRGDLLKEAVAAQKKFVKEAKQHAEQDASAGV